MSFYLNALGVVCAAGHDADSLARSLWATTPGGVQPEPWRGRTLHLGRVRQPLPLPDDTAQRSRNNALLLSALQPIRAAVDAARERFGPLRVAVVLGTSTSGVGESEAAWAHHGEHGELPAWHDVRQQEIGSGAALLATELGVLGPAYVISTACSSSSKALASAARLLQAGLADAVVCGGADSLCDFTVAGFAALEAVSDARCNPLSANRSGINIGEAGALFLMTRERGEGPTVRLAGWGETSDAHHISAPEPSGRGAEAAMRAALAMAGLAPADIGYLNLHGTATPHNDAMESEAVARVFGLDTPCSSTKPLTGHTLGAAGALEAAIAWLTLRGDGALPAHHFDGERDAALPAIRLVQPGERLAAAPRAVLSNSFAFGGSNAALVLTRED
ncbi:3-oxoacyl-[acyl-carrier-protein] synthase-1 [Pelomonas aquatica]|uniref:3-oxoacyl-[acyl-carrier-protein] synthase-1 n=1 Tax=Pelomonas aquatica TaxID=431058 RepID=A0ABU1Z8F5_9BURK|nr:beta-ketoacyl-ACP synthase [Pelomonas aquatica]MDR7296897.1 3-oxoacyl-[acyl-carrier-protein] synthase-1 [Pelomonas aquatica]